MRALNMQALTTDLKNRFPGVVIYGIGDDAHKLSYSDHNEDDTVGSKSSQSDADSNPEHRAIDVMIGPVFTAAEANALVSKMVADPPTQRRLYYIIWNRHIWSRSSGWVMRSYTGDNPHTDHPHFSGWAADDENASSWPIVFASSGSGPAPIPPNTLLIQMGDTGPKVTEVQLFFRNTFPAYRWTVTYKRGVMIVVDGDFGPQTEAWVMEFQRRVGITVDGIVGPNTKFHMRKYGYKG